MNNNKYNTIIIIIIKIKKLSWSLYYVFEYKMYRFKIFNEYQMDLKKKTCM